MTDIIDQLVRIVITSRPHARKRMRLAVTMEEFETIKKFMLENHGVFYARIMNVPLVIEEDPEHPPLVRIP